MAPISATIVCTIKIWTATPRKAAKRPFASFTPAGENSKPETCALEAEAGKGGDDGEPNNFCLLHCLSERARTPRKVKSKEEGTRRAVERPPLTEPAATPSSQPSSPQWQWR